jgi:membrane protein implicated in regulation of membrane protease activity
MAIATDPLSLVFIGSFLFGLLFLVGTLLLGTIGHGHGIAHDVGHSALHHVHVGGDIHHAAHFDHAHSIEHGHHGEQSSTGEKGGNGAAGHQLSFLSIVNPSSVVFFLLGFGFFGYVFHIGTGLGLPLTLLLSIVSGCIIAGLLVTLINRLVGSSQANTELDVSDRTGLVGKVIMTIQENDPGEILYESPGGLRKSIPARSIDGRRIERGQEVVVVNFQKGVAEVDTWEHFINQEEEGEPISKTATDDLEALRALIEGAERDDEEYVLRQDQPRQP